MTVVQIVVGLAVLVGVAVLWANAVKGVDQPRHFVDVDRDGEPDATAYEKESAIEAFHDEQVRRHPEDFAQTGDKPPPAV